MRIPWRVLKLDVDIIKKILRIYCENSRSHSVYMNLSTQEYITIRLRIKMYWHFIFFFKSYFNFCICMKTFDGKYARCPDKFRRDQRYLLFLVICHLFTSGKMLGFFPYILTNVYILGDKWKINRKLERSLAVNEIYLLKYTCTPY